MKTAIVTDGKYRSSIAAAHPADHVTALPEAWFVPMDGFTRRDVYAAFRMERL